MLYFILLGRYLVGSVYLIYCSGVHSNYLIRGILYTICINLLLYFLVDCFVIVECMGIIHFIINYLLVYCCENSCAVVAHIAITYFIFNYFFVYSLVSNLRTKTIIYHFYPIILINLTQVSVIKLLCRVPLQEKCWHA